MNTDYVVVGSIGFAQVGTGEYFAKEKIERQVIGEIVADNELFKVPEELKNIARLKYKTFPHDFGAYRELVVVYDYTALDDNEDLSDQFWNWFNELESFDFESEEIMERCEQLYRETFKMTILPGNKGKDDNNDNLRAV